MNRILKVNIKILFMIFIILDLICIAMGMGVPIFCIFFGFLIGWYISKRVTNDLRDFNFILKRIFGYAFINSIFTFIVMLIIWGQVIPLLFDTDADFVNFGIPLILYEPRISFIGWLFLMILISPFLQLMTTIFASFLTLLRDKSRE